MNVPQTLSMLLLIITVAILGQLVSATTLVRRKREAQLAEATDTDTITGLPNLRSLKHHLENPDSEGKDNKDTKMLGYIAICDYEALVQGFGLQSRNALYSQFVQCQFTVAAIAGSWLQDHTRPIWQRFLIL